MDVQHSTTTPSFTARRKLQTDGVNKTPPAPIQAEISRRFSVMKGQPTPPDTPLKSPVRPPRASSDQPPLFHNYLRAFCKYDPPTDVDGQDAALLLTVRIRPGDLILVHSVHANGWADGTVLTTNTRGWLPTNYCETFDHPYMRNLLNAMTQFWDLLGASQDANLSTFVRQDYIRPLIAGVRYLLEHADCLHRDAQLVQRNQGLHRLRKGLLSDLSTLVQIAKTLQETVRGPFAEEDVLKLLDHSMTKACKVVTRAVGFVDMLARESGGDAVTAAKRASPQHKNVSGLVELEGDVPRGSTDSSIKRYSIHSSSTGGAVHTVRPQSGLTSHRLSMIKSEPRSTSGTLASEQLAQAHDLCISHIAGFIGLYLHPSVPAAELVATTDSLREACNAMLEVVRKISVYEPQGQYAIQQARRSFQAKFEELNSSTDELFTAVDSLEEDIVMLPERTNHLVSLGTSLIKRVGDCVVKIRKVIEQIGDFDLEKPPVVQEETVEHAWPGADEFAAVGFTADREESRSVSSAEQATSPTIRPSSPSTEEGTMASSSGADSFHTASSDAPAMRNGLVATSHLTPSPSKVAMEADARKNSKPSQPGLTTGSPSRKMSVGASISASTDTQKSSMRNSDISAVSEVSTRATTPEHSKDNKESRGFNSFSTVSSLHSTAMRNAITFDDAEAHLLQKTYANELTLNKDGQVTGGSLPALVEQLTMGDTTPDPLFVSSFFMTFRSFTTPRGLAKALIDRFDYVGESGSVALPIRMRIADALQCWLETYWNMDLDKDALGDLRYFALHKLKPVVETPADTLLDVVRKLSILYQNGGTNSHLARLKRKMSASSSGQEEKAPEPNVSKSQLNSLRKAVASEGAADCSILDFDALELARQLTVLASRIFCNIQPEELLSLEWNKKDSSKAENVRNMCTINTDLAHFVGDTILTPEDAKKRALVIKHWSKIASKCLELNNYESLMAIMCSINSSVVQRLKRTWESVSKKTKTRLEEFNAIVDFSRNQTSLRRRLENVQTPCLPFLGIYLTDLTMIDAGNPKHRELPNTNSSTTEPTSVINFDKYVRLVKIITHIQSFQTPYLLKGIPELQSWIEMHLERMRGRQAQMVGDFHRRSLFIEPKRTPLNAPNPSNVPMPKIGEGRSSGHSAAVDSTMSNGSSAGGGARGGAEEVRPKTPAGQTVKSFKPRGQTFEFLLKANFPFKGKQGEEVPAVPIPEPGAHDL